MRQRLGDYEHEENFLGVVSDERAVELSEQRRLLPTALITVTAMVVFAGGLWFAYVQGTRHSPAPVAAGDDNVPLIRADQRPIKVKPDQPGGMDVPDRDKLVFSEKNGGPPVERLLPPPERPEPLPPPLPKQALVAPPPVPALPAVPSGPSPVIETAPASKSTPDAPTQGKTAAAKPSPAPASNTKPAATTGAAPSGVAGLGVRVQLGSLRSPEAARDEWQRLKRINSDLLGKLTAVAVRAEVPDKGTYYRVEAGPLADATAASQLCGELKKRNLGCTIVR